METLVVVAARTGAATVTVSLGRASPLNSRAMFPAEAARTAFALATLLKGLASVPAPALSSPLRAK